MRISSDPELYISNRSSSKTVGDFCSSCLLLEICRKRTLEIKMWVACETPSIEDLLAVDSNDNINKVVPVLEETWDILTDDEDYIGVPSKSVLVAVKGMLKMPNRCTFCEYCANFAYGHKLVCLHDDLPAKETHRYYPWNMNEVIECPKFSEGDSVHLNMEEYHQAEEYSQRNLGDINYDGIREWVLQKP